MRTASRVVRATEPGRQNTVARRVLTLVVAVTVPLIALVAYLWLSQLSEQRTRAFERLQSAVAEVSSEIERLQTQSERIAQYISSRPQIWRMKADACRDELVLLRGLHPEYFNLVIFDRSGRLACSARPFPSGYAYDTLPPWFTQALASPAGAFGDAAPGRIAGRPIVFFAQRLSAPDGRITGVMTLPIPLDYFNAMLVRIGLSGGVMGVLDRNGVFIARVPESERWTGRPSPGLAAATGPHVAPETVRLTGVDGVKRNYLLRTLPGTGWTVYAALPDDVLFAGLYHQVAVGATIIAFVIALSVLLSLLFARRITSPLESLAGTAQAVAAGKRDARARMSGDDEIARVAHQFDAMLDGLSAAEAALRDSNEQLMRLSRRILRAEEDERRRIARDLHDELGQSLTALDLEVQALARHPQDRESARRCLEIASGLHDSVRDLSVLLRPPQLDDLGLAAALRAHIQRHVEGHGVNVTFTASVSGRLPPDIEAACFRIAQEAMTNALRHASASNLHVTLAETPGQIVLAVEDDGKGFDTTAALTNSQAGWSAGLLNMRDRAALAGGEVRIRSSPGQGTRIEATLDVTNATA